MRGNPLNSLLPGNARNAQESKQALRETIQKLCLLGLWRGTFFEHASFYGGTALRMIHGLDRFSEDLDFSLVKANPEIHLHHYLDYVDRELKAWGITARIGMTPKQDSAIESAFIKTETLRAMIDLKVAASGIKELHRDEVSSVKFELDPNPPCPFASESSYILDPIPFSVRVMALPDLFAGKMHAVLARGWKSRVKGRDWYDLIWFVSRGIKLNLGHLEARLRQSGHYVETDRLDRDGFRAILTDRINQIDFTRAKTDVLPFIQNAGAVQNWSRELFLSIAPRIQFG